MTLRTKDNLKDSFSEIMLKRPQSGFNSLDLSVEPSPLPFPHPRMILGELAFQKQTETEVNLPNLEGWFYDCFHNVEQAKKTYPGLEAVTCWPFELYKFVHGAEKAKIFDLGKWGAFKLSRTQFSGSQHPGVHQYTLPPFIQYALCIELWGTNGKWTLFHQRLHTLFDKFKLLNGQAIPGRYCLKAEIQKLEVLGLRGKQEQDRYVLTMPWTFPLSALEKIEKIIPQEF